MKNKKANILTENVIFIILNLVFFSVMILFIHLQSSSVHLNEEEIAKQISLLIDASKPETEISINLKDFFDKAKKQGIDKEKTIEIDTIKNLVTVRGSEDSFYEYGFFNDKVEVYIIQSSESSDNNFLVLKIVEKGEENVVK